MMPRGESEGKGEELGTGGFQEIEAFGRGKK